MFFLLSKIGTFFIQPSTFFTTLALAGWLLLFTSKRRLGQALCGAGILFLLLAGLTPAANWLMQPLEQRFASGPLPDQVAGIIVLGGAFSTRAADGRGTLELNASAERLTRVPALAARYPEALIVHTGGHNHLVGTPGMSEADAALQIFREFGIAPERIVLEARARNTYENAVFTKEILAGRSHKPWLLVTSAYHMPRAMGAFRQAGFHALIPFPVDFRVPAVNGEFSFFAAASSGLKRFDTAFKEWVGLLVYWLTGRSSALFPAP